MERRDLQKLIAWKNSTNRKPLLLQGARQVGKTYLIKDFAKREFEDIAYIDFMVDENMKSVFAGSLTPDRLLDAISLQTGKAAGDPGVLVILDEIQECPRALTSLKYFNQDKPDIPIIAAGSLLGVALHGGKQEISFPVGKVDHMTMHPMTFVEFLIAQGEQNLANLIEGGDESLLNAFSEKLTEQLKRYYVVGGMPEAVDVYAQTHDIDEARAVQKRLLTDYELDFSKYATPALTERIRLVWKSLPAQLARENKKFVYSAVKPGARARDYEEAIQWLVDAGLVLRINRIKKPGIPLSAYEDKDAFKLYCLDIGLLGTASGLNANALVQGNGLFTEFKGALTENYVFQEMAAKQKVVPYYWSADNSSGEVDMVYEYDERIQAVEVKAETNLKAKSLRNFVSKYGLEPGLRLSLSGFAHQSWVVNIPLYATSLLPESIDINAGEKDE